MHAFAHSDVDLNIQIEGFMLDLFGQDHSLAWWQECDRAVVVLVYGLVMVRLAGPRTFSKWGALDTVVSIIVGSNLSRTLTGGAPLGGTLAATTLVFALHWLLARTVVWSAFASRMLEGWSKTLARDGVLDRKVKAADAISDIDIEEALREKGLQHVSETRLVVIEPSGKINVLKA